MASPTHVRRNVWDLGTEWADPILWYARGVQAMQKRPLAEPTSWRFYAAIHGINRDLWRFFGYFDPAADQEPSTQLENTFWGQCQHGSWYFLPWHRGYLRAFEAVVRDAVVTLGGPADWTLPYWNYFKKNQSGLPTAFSTPDWPDGKGDNPLFVQARYGPQNTGTVFVDLDDVNLDAMNEPLFSGSANGGSRGFGGIDTGFMHGGRLHGQLENQPHDQVHGDVGGGTRQDPGVMSIPDSAALDPIFWLHHANIDRLWEVWRLATDTHVDPQEQRWLGGPAATGGRRFTLPMPNGATTTFTPQDMDDLAALDYGYDDYTKDGKAPPVTPIPPIASRMLRLGAPAPAMPDDLEAATVADAEVELVGANAGGPLPVTGDATTTTVTLDPAPRAKVEASLTQVAGNAAPAPPDRVFLHLENVRGRDDTPTLRVYLAPPGPGQRERMAGSVALFGVRKASDPNGEHGGAGLSYALDVTRIVDDLHLDAGFDQEQLQVRIVPRAPLADDADITIGRISIYREAGTTAP